MNIYSPDFNDECYICGTSPCVLVNNHIQPHTLLCGIHFFNARKMVDYNLWNGDEDEESYEH